MSATNRGGARDKRDRHFTPLPLACAIVDKLMERQILHSRCIVLEPSVGKGAFLDALRRIGPLGLRVYARDVYLRAEPARIFKEAGWKGGLAQGSFLTRGPDWRYQQEHVVILGNPPFDHAQQHIEHALKILPEGGTLAFLLPLNFLGSHERFGTIHQEHRVSQVDVVVGRPSFGTMVTCSRKHASPSCTFTRWLGTGNKFRKRCPRCGAKLRFVRTDHNEYGLFTWYKRKPNSCVPYQTTLSWLPWSWWREKLATNPHYALVYDVGKKRWARG